MASSANDVTSSACPTSLPMWEHGPIITCVHSSHQVPGQAGFLVSRAARGSHGRLGVLRASVPARSDEPLIRSDGRSACPYRSHWPAGMQSLPAYGNGEDLRILVRLWRGPSDCPFYRVSGNTPHRYSAEGRRDSGTVHGKSRPRHLRAATPLKPTEAWTAPSALAPAERRAPGPARSSASELRASPPRPVPISAAPPDRAGTRDEAHRSIRRPPAA